MSQAMAPSPSPAGVAPNGGGGEVVGEVVVADEAGGVGAARACAEEAPLSQSAKVAGADDEKSVAVLMRPHVGSRVRVVGGDGTGCLKVGEIGRVVEDDRSPIPFKVDAGNGDTSWYREDQLEHLAEYTVEDVLDQQRMVSLFADNSATAFNVSNTRFSFQASRAREATTGMLHPRTIGRNWQRAASATSQACCPWCADPRHRPLVMFVLYLCVLIPFVVGFTVSHALGYKALKQDLVHDRFQYLRNDGCLATRQMLGVARARGLGWPSLENSEPVPPRATPARHQHSGGNSGSSAGRGGDRVEALCREETKNARIRCAYAASSLACSASFLGEIPGRPCCSGVNAVGHVPELLQQTGCHCGCADYEEILQAPDPPPPPAPPCVPVDDLPPGFLSERGFDYDSLPHGQSLPCQNHGNCKTPEAVHPYCACVDGWTGPTCEDFATPTIPDPGVVPGESPEKACRRYLEARCKSNVASIDSCNECVHTLWTITDWQNPCRQATLTAEAWCAEALHPPPPAPEPQPLVPVPCNQLNTCEECEVHVAQQGTGEYGPCGWCRRSGMLTDSCAPVADPCHDKADWPGRACGY